MNSKVIYINGLEETLLLTEDIRYIKITLDQSQKHTLSGNLYFSEKEKERKVLLIINFENKNLTEKESKQYGFSYSKKYGSFKYLTSDSDNKFTFSFSVPKDFKTMTLGIRKWYTEYDTYISSALVLQENENTELLLLEDFSKKHDKHLNALIHMYSRKDTSDYLVLTTRYPMHNDYYRNSFIHTRVREYIKNDVNIDVFSMIRNDNTLEQYRYEKVHVTIGSDKHFNSLLTFYPYKKCLVHFLNEKMWNYLERYIDFMEIIVWVHGAEIQPWHRRSFNYTTDEERKKAKILSKKKISFWQKILSPPHPNLNLIFVSKYFANEVMEDLEVKLPKESYRIIHNFIDTNLFSYKKKSIVDRKKILSIRPYASKKYANDLSVKAVLYIKEYFPQIFKNLVFTFIGDGELFNITLEPLKSLTNVKIEKKFLKQKDIAKIHKEYGLFLCPTRMDSQGVSRDEAMSSGLVPVTNNTTAIPEFLDETCGILAEDEDYIGLANGIIQLYNDPDKFLDLSKNAAKRVRKQSSYSQTILQEVNIIKHQCI